MTHTPGGDVTMRPGGRPADVHLANSRANIHHGLNGQTRVEAIHGDRRIVAERHGQGYVQQRYAFRGWEYGHRTYYNNGRAYDLFYHGYTYRGVYVQMYTPAYYYRPAFYGWAYAPWVKPVPYAWNWNGAPWYGHYNGYFTPYSAYASPSAWLTDYMVSSILAEAFQAGTQAFAQQPFEGAVPLSLQVKDLVAAEVRRQISVENAEAQPAAQMEAPNPALSGIQAVLGEGVHVFVAGREIYVTDASGMECAIGGGDVLQLIAPIGNSDDANFTVLSSKGGRECRAGNTVTVSVADIQDMQNQMREKLDQGLAELQTKQGTGGLPTLPASASGPPVKTAFAAEAPPLDANAATEIAQELQKATEAEQSILNQRSEGERAEQPTLRMQDSDTAPATLHPGLTLGEIVAILGSPTTIADLGGKKLYVYPNLKITFQDGRATKIE